MAYADDATREIDQHFIDQRRSQESPFKTIPGTHITPVNNRVIFTLMVHTLDARIKGLSPDGQVNGERLRVKSYSVAPYIALSGQHFGAGISGELGEAWTRYENPEDETEERSTLRYQGLGGQLFYTPMEKDSPARLTFVAGTQILGVKHKAKSNRDHLLIEADEWEHQDYQVARSRIGANWDLRILEDISLIPWADHTYTYSKDLSSRIDHSNQDKRVRLRERFAGDNDIFWQPGSHWQYGLDAAVRFDRFEFHFGNLLGAVLTPRSGSDRIENHSYSVSMILLTPTDD